MSSSIDVVLAVLITYFVEIRVLLIEARRNSICNTLVINRCYLSYMHPD